MFNALINGSQNIIEDPTVRSLRVYPRKVTPKQRFGQELSCSSKADSSNLQIHSQRLCFLVYASRF